MMSSIFQLYYPPDYLTLYFVYYQPNYLNKLYYCYSITNLEIGSNLHWANVLQWY